MCASAGCAFDEILIDPNTVYIKLDDDIVFVKDGSIEHLAYQTLTNKDYTYFSGNVVNNPHGYAVQKFIGAFVPTSFHYNSTHQNIEPPFFNYSHAAALYW